MFMLTSLPSASKSLILPLINCECLREFPENKAFNKYLMAEEKEMHVFHAFYINCIRAKFLSFLSVSFGLASVLFTYSANTLLLLCGWIGVQHMANQLLMFSEISMIDIEKMIKWLKFCISLFYTVSNFHCIWLWKQYLLILWEN